MYLRDNGFNRGLGIKGWERRRNGSHILFCNSLAKSKIRQWRLIPLKVF